MKAVALLGVLSVGSWIVVAAMLRPAVRLELLLGMVGPWLAVSISWIVAERTYRLRPEALTAVMTAAFGAKIAFFGAYVAVVLRVGGVAVEPFIASFLGYFIGLYVIEALFLRRLFR